MPPTFANLFKPLNRFPANVIAPKKKEAKISNSKFVKRAKTEKEMERLKRFDQMRER